MSGRSSEKSVSGNVVCSLEKNMKPLATKETGKMKGRLFKSLVFILVLAAFMMPLVAEASKIKHYDFSFNVGEQGIPANSVTGVLNVETAFDFTGKIKLEVEALADVIPSSSDDVSVMPENIPIQIKSANGSVALSFSISFSKPDGEYFLRATLLDQKDKPVFSESHFFHIEKGLCFSGVHVESTLANIIRYKVGKNLSHEAMRSELKKVFEERHILKEKKDSVVRESQPRGSAIKSGDKVSLKINWTYKTTLMPVRNARIAISDTESGTEINTPEKFLSDTGTFSFTAWKDDPKFKVKIYTEFAGINGKSSFTVQRNTDMNDTTPETIFFDNLTQDNVNNGTINYDFPAPSSPGTLSEIDLSAWSVFHGVQDIFRTAQNQLGIDFGTTKVYFASYDTSGNELGTFKTDYYFGMGVYILKVDRYDWDVLAHEFAHVADKENNISQLQGGSHDGSNQYVYSGDSSTLNNKEKSFSLAFSEGFATFWAISLNQYSSYKGKIDNIGDSYYDDIEDNPTSPTRTSMDDNDPKVNKKIVKGDDTELALQNLLWDIYDTGKESYTVAGVSMEDSSAYALKDMWAMFKGGKFNNIYEFWKKNFLPDGAPKNLTKETLQVSPIFCNFGISPILTFPKDGDQLKPADPNKEIKFEWNVGVSTMDAVLKLNQFRLVLYKDDYSAILWDKEFKKNDPSSYTFTDQDRKDLLAKLNQYKGDVVAVVFGKNDGSDAQDGKIETGYYASNGVKLVLTNYDHFVAVVVDSSGSNGTTDPKKLRVIAAKQTVNRLMSWDKAKTANKLPDLAAAIDFDSSVKVLNNFDDPARVEPVFSLIDSSGSTDIAAGIDQAALMLTRIVGTGLTTYIKNRAAIVVFTDGENNAGPLPVIQAILNARLKGIRVHYGFLSPKTVTRNADVRADTSTINTIEEAVQQSGGVYALIGDAASQVAFVNTINSMLTNADDNRPNQTSLTDAILQPNLQVPAQLGTSGQIACYSYLPQIKNESVTILMETKDFKPVVWVSNYATGKILAADYDDDGDGKINLEITLPDIATYYVYVAAQDDRTGVFKTEIRRKGIFPVAITDAPSDMTTDSAAFNALINPNGKAVRQWYFEHGTESEVYTHQTASQSLSAGNDYQNVKVVVKNLTPQTGYYYRVVAIGEEGTAVGEEFSFVQREDKCPNDPYKMEAGICECGVPDTDTDGDGVSDCKDGCPNDPKKTQPGLCGCGVAETSGCGAYYEPTYYEPTYYAPPANQPPTADKVYVITEENKPVAVKLTGSDPDVPGMNWFMLAIKPVTYSVVTQPLHGTLSGTAPDLTYTPAAGYIGTDSFTFKLSDGTADSAPATVSLVINPVGSMYVDDSLALSISCAEYQGVRYGFKLDYSKSSDPSGLYWKMDTSTIRNVGNTGGSCISVGNDLKISVPSAIHRGTTYQFSLNYTPLSSDTSGHYWKMDLGTFKSR